MTLASSAALIATATGLAAWLAGRTQHLEQGNIAVALGLALLALLAGVVIGVNVYPRLCRAIGATSIEHYDLGARYYAFAALFTALAAGALSAPIATVTIAGAIVGFRWTIEQTRKELGRRPLGSAPGL